MRVRSLGFRQRGGRGRLKDAKRPLIAQYTDPWGLGRKGHLRDSQHARLFELVAMKVGS